MKIMGQGLSKIFRKRMSPSRRIAYDILMELYKDDNSFKIKRPRHAILYEMLLFKEQKGRWPRVDDWYDFHLILNVSRSNWAFRNASRKTKFSVKAIKFERIK